jgi:LPS sulfotransferase NodH
MLALALADFGGLGTPIEYFNPAQRDLLTERWACADGLDSYLAALHGHRTTSEGLFGTKLHWHQLIALRNELLGPERAPGRPNDVEARLLERVLPACRYIWILRKDVVGQAVSLFIGLSTGRWAELARSPVDPRPTPAYDFGFIDRCRRRIELEEACWARFFRANGITPFVVVYEDLETTYADTLRSTLEFIGVDPGAHEMPQPPIRKQRDRISEEYIAAYGRDCAARGTEAPRLLPADPLLDLTGRASDLETEHQDLLGLVTASRVGRCRRVARRLRKLSSMAP